MKYKSLLAAFGLSAFLAACISTAQQDDNRRGDPAPNGESPSEIISGRTDRAQVSLIESYNSAFERLTCAKLASDLGDLELSNSFKNRGIEEVSEFYQAVIDGEIDRFHYVWHAPLTAIGHADVVKSSTSMPQLIEQTETKMASFVDGLNSGDRAKTRDGYEKLCRQYE